MSCSSESDVTIPIEDSPEPSPPHKRSTGRGGGVDNKGYVSSKDEKKDTSLVLETRLDSNIVNLIPAKPSPQLGPFEPLNDYFIPINHHKKFLRLDFFNKFEIAIICNSGQHNHDQCPLPFLDEVRNFT